MSHSTLLVVSSSGDTLSAASAAASIPKEGIDETHLPRVPLVVARHERSNSIDSALITAPIAANGRHVTPTQQPQPQPRRTSGKSTSSSSPLSAPPSGPRPNEPDASSSSSQQQSPLLAEAAAATTPTRTNPEPTGDVLLPVPMQRLVAWAWRDPRALTSLVIGVLVVLLAILLAMLLVRGKSSSPPTAPFAVFQLAKELSSDECIPVQDYMYGSEEIDEILKALRYHSNAGGWMGMCAQHLSKARPLCVCVIRRAAVPIGDKMVGVADEDYIDMYNAEIMQSTRAFADYEDSNPLCQANGHMSFWTKYKVNVTAVFMSTNGGRTPVALHERAFTPETGSFALQHFDGLMEGIVICGGDDTSRLLRKIYKRMGVTPNRERGIVNDEYMMLGSGQQQQQQQQPQQLPPPSLLPNQIGGNRHAK